MKIVKSFFNNRLFLLDSGNTEDERGVFRKVFHSEIFSNFGFEATFNESFYSISKQDVLRGMHMQVGAFAHDKLVYVSSGKILDVVLDTDPTSTSYGSYESFDLSSNSGRYLYIRKGLAHGFLSLTDFSVTNYLLTTVHSPAHDCGFRWDSFGFDWGVSKPIISKRDLELPRFK